MYNRKNIYKGSYVMRKNSKILLALLLCFVVLFISGCKEKDTRLAVDSKGRTVVERYGQLQVIGTNLCNQEGLPVQLRGMSSHGLQWHGKYANYNVLKWLRDDWNAQLWRSAMYVTQGGYAENKGLKFKVYDSIDAAIELGMYVIVDWHIVRDRDPLLAVDLAVEFFSDIAQKYGHVPNVIYEICNEPNGDEVTWEGNIKPYAERVIPAIRQYDPDNIIIVGTPTWSQDVDIASNDPLEGDNIMYTLHFYAGTHGDVIRAKAEYALKNGAPLFVTEWGTTQSTGDGGVFEAETIEWLKFLQKNNISWANWSICNNGEDSGALYFNADRAGKGGWTDKDLSNSGRFIRKILRNETKLK